MQVRFTGFLSTLKTLAPLLIVFAVSVHAALPEAGLTAPQKVRYQQLCRRLMASCCWTQSLETHSSPEADRERAAVASLLLAGNTDRQILDAFIRQYGERILTEPEGAKAVVLTAVPIMVFSGGAVFLFGFLVYRRQFTVPVEDGPTPSLPDFDSDWRPPEL